MKVLNQRNLPQERLATTDEKGRRVYIFPARVSGVFRNLRTLTQIFLILILLVLPWIKINGNQAVLFDVFDKKFAFFGLTFWSHDAPLIFFLLALLCIGLAFVTAIWGRVWCGWACPQTVFIDGIFRRIEYWIIGSEIKQKNLAKSSFSSEKATKYTAVWICFLVISIIISHSFLAYFVGAERLVEMTQHSPKENWTIFVVMAFITSILLFDFGWFREQFCIIMCPYGRFQSVLIDDDSLAVTYDYNRGEPRRNTVENPNQEGDCIDCYRCVAVCPTGIDIREGLQMECIACTACIDACDEVMEKVEKPKGLIRYDTPKGIEGLKSNIFRARTTIYLALLIFLFFGLVYLVSKKEDYLITILRAQDKPYSVVENNSGQKEVINHFKVHLKNHKFQNADLKIYLPNELSENGIQLITQTNTISLAPGKDSTIHFFIKFPNEILDKDGKKIVKVNFIDTEKNNLEKEVKLVGPISSI